MRTAEAVSLETVDRKAKNTINISNCLDIEKGTVTVSVENPDADDQVINIDIDGEVYTTGARTKVWGGDVDFAFRKYDTPEPTIELNSLDVPAYKDTENNRTLYMKLNNRIRTLASTDNIKLSDVQTKASIKSLTDKKTHIINLGSYSDESGDDPVIPTPDPSDHDKPNPSPTPGKNTSASSGDNTTIKKTANPFRDVSESDWFYDYVTYAYEKGLMKGTEADLFEPETDVTRAMFVTVLHRMEGTPRVGTVNFDDVDGGEYYADGTFAPQKNSTRAETAAVFQRIAENLK